MEVLSKKFKDTGMDDLPQVGGKNASLGEMISKLSAKGVAVPDGFALTAEAYRLFLRENNLNDKLAGILSSLDTQDYSNLKAVGKKCRELILSGVLPQLLQDKIRKGYEQLTDEYGKKASFAVRSSATAEDLPNASFAGQQETFLNVAGLDHLLEACLRCYASLFTDRAIKYREDNGFEHMQVALSVGVQLMVRADKACSGVLFTIDPDSGFDKVTLISGAWGLGENVVQGSVNTDEFLVYKPFLGKVKQPVISHKLGSKLQMMTYADETKGLTQAKQAVINRNTPEEMQQQYVLKDEEIIRLAEWGNIIEGHYGKPMDIEWAKDGLTGELFIVQARPETVHSQRKNKSILRQCHIYEKGELLCQGMAIGHCVADGKARILKSPKESDKLQKGEILVTQRTDPDWDPVMQKAGAIVTDQGGRTSHAAIVARELGVIAVVGTGDGSKKIKDGQHVTVSTAEGDRGYVYEGISDWEQEEVDTSHVVMPKTEVMLILGRPEQAFRYTALPNAGVGLMRMEFIINNVIGIHPMALRHFDTLEDPKAKELIEQLTAHYPDKKSFFIRQLAEATATLAAAFYPKPVIVRMSDFKTNEYAELIGGKQFEPEEQNPMIGFRGASRYHHPLYREGFEMECAAMKIVREEMGFRNVKLMIPFCRTTKEAEKVIGLMKELGLERGKDELEIYLMVEIPSNALLAEEFAELVDGFSIGSNDLTQLTLGADRDSELLEEVFSPFDPAVMQLIRMAIEKARKAGKKIGLCGQAPSDYPEFARFLVDCGINSISFNPDALLQGIKNIREAEGK